MSPSRHAISREQDLDSIVGWRARRLVRAGLDRAAAERIAANPDYDLHAVFELVDRGCPVELAVRILAPLDENAAP